MRLSFFAHRWMCCLCGGTAILLLCPDAIHAQTQSSRIDLLRVAKSEHRIYLISEGRVVDSFHVALGPHPVGAKQQEGDGKTPEGHYMLDYGNANSAFHKAFHVSYPNANDQQAAQRHGVKPDGMIMLHGQKNGFGWLGAVSQRFNWTDGCIAVSDQDMDQLWQRVHVPVPIQIDP